MAAATGYWRWYGHITAGLYAILAAVAVGLAIAAAVIHALGLDR